MSEKIKADLRNEKKKTACQAIREAGKIPAVLYGGGEENQDIVLDRVEDAKHYTIAVQRNDIAQDVLIKKGFEVGTNIFLTASIAESWQLLSRGKVDFVIDDEDNIQAMESKYLLIDQKARSVIDISELSLDTWLAANIQSNPALINSIKRHF